jgi:hypothetical protein
MSGQAWPLRISPPPDVIPPRAELAELPASVERGAVVPVRGRAVDARLARYRLILTGGGASSVIADSQVPVWLGALGQVRTAGFAPGGYRLDLVVEDRAGSVGTASRYLVIAPRPVPLVSAPGR